MKSNYKREQKYLISFYLLCPCWRYLSKTSVEEGPTTTEERFSWTFHPACGRRAVAVDILPFQPATLSDVWGTWLVIVDSWATLLCAVAVALPALVQRAALTGTAISLNQTKNRLWFHITLWAVTQTCFRHTPFNSKNWHWQRHSQIYNLMKQQHAVFSCGITRE